MAYNTDKELLEKIIEGNESAFELIFIKYYDPLCKYAYSIMQNKNEVEEIVQSVFVKVWEYHKNIQVKVSLKSYLYQMVHNAVANELKRKKIVQKHAEILGRLNLSNPISENYPIANLISQELEEKIEKEIAALPEQCRLIFIKYKFEEKSYKEIAEEMNISNNTIKTQLRRAIQKLREAFREYFPLIIFILLETL